MGHDETEEPVVRLTRLLLLLYPPSFRREVGAAVAADVARRVADHADDGSRARYARCLRLVASLLANAPAAWLEEVSPRRRRARRRRERRAWILGRGARASSLSWLDIKLGLRMLIKHPGLTLAGGLGIAVAIGVSTGFFAFMNAWALPTPPLEEGDRLVALQSFDVERNFAERRVLHDFVLWREEMRSVEDMTAFRGVNRNLITGDASPEPILVAEMTPSGFALARVPPLMGRTLLETDAEPGARDVLVIGYDVWRTRFAADPDVVGRDVRLGHVVHTIVGVMPEGFAFPVDHSFWTLLREDPADHPRGGGPWIYVSGRLAPGYTLEDAQSELGVIEERMAADFPETHAHLRAQVMPYTYPWSFFRGSTASIFRELALVNSSFSLLLLVVGLNVAVLVYARTATRRGEIAVRTALGATRGRIVGQLFAESLVLAAGAAVVGLGLAKVGLQVANEFQTRDVGATPFWFDLRVPGPAVAYAVLLAVLAAVITGVVPGLQATGRRVRQNLREYRGGSGLRLGRMWTTLIVLQVAVTVAVVPIGFAFGWGEIARLTRTPTYPVDRFLVVWALPDQTELSEEASEEDRQLRAAGLAGVRSELARRMEAEPGVVAHTPVLDLPSGGRTVRVALEGAAGGVASDDHRRAQSIRVHPDLFGPLEVDVLAGRPILPADLEEGAADVALVDRRFVRLMLGGGDPLGRRMRIVGTGPFPVPAEGTERWVEIVGVVENLHASRGDDALVDPVVYLPMPSGFVDDDGAGLMLKVAGVDPTSLSARVREIAAELDPTLRVFTNPLTESYRLEELTVAITALLLGAGVASVLLLSAAGIYALMSVTVSQRRREIGIRTALGAQRGRLLGGIFRRALGQLGAGVVLGVGLALLWDLGAGGDALGGHGVVLLGSMVVVMVGVGLVAASGPARRGLGVAPAEALQSE